MFVDHGRCVYAIMDDCLCGLPSVRSIAQQYIYHTNVSVTTVFAKTTTNGQNILTVFRPKQETTKDTAEFY
jgi:hypothetical protein